MKASTKIALVTVSLLSMGALTACQSTSAPQQEHNARMMGHHNHDRQMTPEQRAQMKQMRAERKAMHEQMQKACDGKALGQAVQVKSGKNTLDGSCDMVFKVDRKAMNEMKHDMRHDQSRMMQGHYRGEQRMQQMTAEQHAQIQQQRQQKRAEYQAKRDAMQKACAGQTNGKAIQVKFGEKTVDGTCVVKFQVQKPIQPMQPLAPATELKTS